MLKYCITKQYSWSEKPVHSRNKHILLQMMARMTQPLLQSIFCIICQAVWRNHFRTSGEKPIESSWMLIIWGTELTYLITFLKSLPQLWHLDEDCGFLTFDMFPIIPEQLPNNYLSYTICPQAWRPDLSANSMFISLNVKTRMSFPIVHSEHNKAHVILHEVDVRQIRMILTACVVGDFLTCEDKAHNSKANDFILLTTVCFSLHWWVFIFLYLVQKHHTAFVVWSFLITFWSNGNLTAECTSTQSRDVWPPSESIQEGKINTEEKLFALYYRQMRGIKDSITIKLLTEGSAVCFLCSAGCIFLILPIISCLTLIDLFSADVFLA